MVITPEKEFLGDFGSSPSYVCFPIFAEMGQWLTPSDL